MLLTSHKEDLCIHFCLHVTYIKYLNETDHIYTIFHILFERAYTSGRAGSNDVW